MRLEIWHINGRVTQVADMYQDDMAVPVRVETSADPTSLAATHYVQVEASLVERPAMDVPSQVDAVAGQAVSIAVPDPVTVTVGQQSAKVVGGVFEFTAAAADTYTVHLSAWPLRDATLTIVVTEAPDV